LWSFFHIAESSRRGTGRGRPDPANPLTGLDTGAVVDAALVRPIVEEELAGIRAEICAEAYEAGRYGDARAPFEQVALADDVVDRLTLPAYARRPRPAFDRTESPIVSSNSENKSRIVEERSP
jgi:hypothetical protein